MSHEIENGSPVWQSLIRSQPSLGISEVTVNTVASSGNWVHVKPQWIKIVIASHVIFSSMSVMASVDSDELGRRVGDFIGWNAAADVFKTSRCRDAIKDGNPGYLKRDHFTEAVDLIRMRYRDNQELQGFMSHGVQLERIRNQLMRQTAERLAVTLGQSPSPQMCGFINAEIDNQIKLKQSGLP